MPSLATTAKDFLSRVVQQERLQSSRLREVNRRANELLKACNAIEDSWSGSSFGYHWNLYYGNFERPPLQEQFSVEWGGINGFSPEWMAHEPEEVKQRIEQDSQVSPTDLTRDVTVLVEAAKQLQTEILIALAPLHDAQGMSKEKELLQQLEKWNWRDDERKEYCARRMNSFPHVTRDSEAFMQGMRLPTHTYYEAVAHQAEAYCEATRYV